jgi:uncharacterized DUF497 family protein
MYAPHIRDDAQTSVRQARKEHARANRKSNTAQVPCNYKCSMIYLVFERDPRKAQSNLRKHGIAFAEAGRVFLDLNRIETYDGMGRRGEDRWKTIGLVEFVLIVVVYTMRGDDANIIRLISARKADNHEQSQYGQT